MVAEIELGVSLTAIDRYLGNQRDLAIQIDVLLVTEPKITRPLTVITHIFRSCLTVAFRLLRRLCFLSGLASAHWKYSLHAFQRPRES